MTFEQAYVFSVLGVTLALFIWGRWRYDAVAVVALLAVVFGGVIDTEAAFLGFGHPAVITVATVLIISRTLQGTGIVGWLAGRLGRAELGPSLQVGMISALVAALSGFMNNVGALALLMPVVLQIARRTDRSPHDLLMPLSFGSLLGGLVTMIGTPPNIIVATYREDFSGTAFGMFDFSPVGLAVAVVGLLFISTIGWRLIPDRSGDAQANDDPFRIENYITEVLVPRKSPLIGLSIEELLVQGGEEGIAVVALVRRGQRRLGPRPDEILRSADHLLLEGEPTGIEGLLNATGLKPVGTRTLDPTELSSSSIGLVEAVISPHARLVGRTSRQAQLGRHYGLNLLAMARHGRPIRDRLNRLRFRPGDVLLVQGNIEAMPETLSQLGCLPLPDRNLGLDRQPTTLPIFIFAAAIATVALGWVSAPIAFFTTVLIFVFLGRTTLREVYDAIDWPIIVLLAALVPVGGALEQSGGTALIANGVAALAAYLSPVWILVLVMAAAMILSDIVNNAATAVLMAPLAAEIATRLGVSADPFLMAVAIGSSCAFLTPIGHQSNVLVMGPGGYRFGDYWPMGLPLEVLILLVATPVLLLVWPL